MSESTATLANLPPEIGEAIREFTALLQSWDCGTRAISLGGSFGKGTFDDRSDLDFRLFHAHDVPWPDRDPERWKPVWVLLKKWGQRGVKIDGVWPRSIAEVDAALRRAISGEIKTDAKEWSIWGYHLLTDVYNQYVIDDSQGVLAAWKRLLTPYPPALKQAVIKKHLGSLRYWRRDYHYANKVERKDVVFLASLSARLIHDLMQVLFALNEVYFPGDGTNFSFAEKFAIKPADLPVRVTAALYPSGANIFDVQCQILLALIDEVEALAKGY